MNTWNFTFLTGREVSVLMSLLQSCLRNCSFCYLTPPPVIPSQIQQYWPHWLAISSKNVKMVSPYWHEISFPHPIGKLVKLSHKLQCAEHFLISLYVNNHYFPNWLNLGYCYPWYANHSWWDELYTHFTYSPTNASMSNVLFIWFSMVLMRYLIE